MQTSGDLDDTLPMKGNRVNLISILFGECLCVDDFRIREGGYSTFSSSKSQTIELAGVECISLGAVVEELTPRQRVNKTVEQLSTNTERLISIGYIKEDYDFKDGTNLQLPISASQRNKIMETMPLEVYVQNFPEDLGKSLSKKLFSIVKHVKQKKFELALSTYATIIKGLRKNISVDHNNCLLGLALHNMAVINLLAGKEKDSIPLFQESVMVKKAAFGENHLEVAISLDELGIQYFANGENESALSVFENARKIRQQILSKDSHQYAMVLNNIACVRFLMDQPKSALAMFQEAKDIQLRVMKSSSTVGLDLIHVGTTLCNMAYMQLHLKRYDEALPSFQEALLIQQSVLGDDHETIRATLSNIEFSNGFHSL